MKVLTWHVHGNYLYYLTQAPHDFYVVTRPGYPAGYAGIGGHLPWGPNVHEIEESRLHELDVDCVIHQSPQTWNVDRLQKLSAQQRGAPSVYLEHDPPQQHPTDTRHPAADGDAHIVHVTHFNALMWDNGDAATSVIEHGVCLPDDAIYSGERPKGIVVVNHLRERGRRLGLDVFLRLREQVPLELVGMDATSLGGAGEIPNHKLPAHVGHYRFFFNPIRYTSLGLAVVEAMSVGLPIVGLATTELATVIRNNVNGYIDTREDRLVEVMKLLLEDAALARRWGDAARETATQRFGIRRFADDWDRLLRRVAVREAVAA